MNVEVVLIRRKELQPALVCEMLERDEGIQHVRSGHARARSVVIEAPGN
jgi:hypothetical protein